MFVGKHAFYCLILFIFLICKISANHHRNNHKVQHHVKEETPSVSTKELRKVSEELFDKLSRNIFQSLSINYQGQRDSKDAKDEAPEPLLNVPRDLFETVPTIQLMRKLYDNYDINSYNAEDVLPEEDLEENQFIDGLLDTDIMIHTMDFLASKGYFSKNLNEYKMILKKIWFTPYSRSNHTAMGSSGFEHIFLVEQKRHRHITGLHNWIFFAIEEYDHKADYLGYITKKQLSDKAAVIKFYLSYLDKTKLTSMFIGTPPEFEIALYTLCFYSRPNKSCNIILGNVKIPIQTWIQYSNNEELVGTSYPKIYN